MMKNCLLILLVAAAVTSCTPARPLYNWKGYDDAVYSYTKKSDEKSTENLIKIYEKLIKNSGGAREVPPPGICADYGFLVIQKGENEKGKELLTRETELYPESKIFIDRILKRYQK
jgi:hypothetical protein